MESREVITMMSFRDYIKLVSDPNTISHYTLSNKAILINKDPDGVCGGPMGISGYRSCTDVLIGQDIGKLIDLAREGIYQKYGRYKSGTLNKYYWCEPGGIKDIYKYIPEQYRDALRSLANVDGIAEHIDLVNPTNELVVRYLVNDGYSITKGTDANEYLTKSKCLKPKAIMVMKYSKHRDTRFDKLLREQLMDVLDIVPMTQENMDFLYGPNMGMYKSESDVKLSSLGKMYEVEHYGSGSKWV